MSWNFSVTEQTKEDALRVFNNTRLDSANAVHIPDDVSIRLNDAAGLLLNDIPNARKVTIRAHGHINATGDGTGDYGVSVIIAALPEATPNEFGNIHAASTTKAV